MKFQERRLSLDVKENFLNVKVCEKLEKVIKGHCRDFCTGDLQEKMRRVHQEAHSYCYSYQTAQERKSQFHKVAPSPQP